MSVDLYGYRRVWASPEPMAARRWQAGGQQKSVLRIMQIERSDVERYTAPPSRPHPYDGVVVALRLNIRWCSDHLEIHASQSRVVVRILRDRRLRPGDHRLVRVANAGVSARWCDLDGRCRRTAASGQNANAASHHRMVVGQRQRLHDTSATPPTWPAPRPQDVVHAGAGSPEATAQSESFVKTLKRDYARLNVLTDADAILYAARLDRGF